MAIAGPRTLRHSSPYLSSVLEPEDGNTALTVQVMRRPRGAGGASGWRDLQPWTLHGANVWANWKQLACMQRK